MVAAHTENVPSAFRRGMKAGKKGVLVVISLGVYFMKLQVMTSGAGCVGNQLVLRYHDEVIHNTVSHHHSISISLLCSSVSHVSFCSMTVTLSILV